MSAQSIHALPAGQAAYSYSPRLRPWLRERLDRYDGVILHGLWTHYSWAASRECRDRSIPYAYFTHGMLEPWSIYGQGLWKATKKLLYWHLRERLVCANAASLLFTTEREAHLARQTFPLEVSTSVLAPSGFAADCPVHTEPTNTDLLQPGNRKVALFLGRVHPKKNVEFLLQAWSKAQLGREWRLLIAGPVDVAYRRRLDQLIRHLQLGNVYFTGFVSKLDRAYLFQRADWFLLPSIQENFGIAVLEAVSHGCPVAISNQVYLSESFRPESEVLPLELDRWVEFLRHRLPDPGWRAKTAAADRQHLLQKFEIQRVAKTWLDTLQRLFT